MALTAQNAIFGFGPQTGKGAIATTFYKHKALSMDFGVQDDARLGPLEIGGSPFPTFPYKAGYVVGGGVVVQPRLENTMGWLLMATMGASTPTQLVSGGTAQVETATAAGTITAGGYAKAVVTASGLTGSPVTIRALVATNDTAATWAGKMRSALAANYYINSMFVVGGTTTSIVLTKRVAATDDATLNIALDNDTCTGITTAASSVDTTAGSAGTNSGVYRHDFVPDTNDLGHVRWMTLRKYIPMKDAVATTDLGETFTDCKPTALSFTVENDQPIQARWDFLGRAYSFVDDISGWSWSNASYENYQSVPVGCEVSGGVTFTGGGLVNATLPAVRATVNIANQTLPPREERIIGDPGLEDITVVERRMTFDVTMKYNDPDLYRAILTGNISGSEWSAMPFTGNLALKVTSPYTINGYKYSLEITSNEVMWQMNGALQLAAGQAVMMRFTGTAIEPTTGEYSKLSIVNAQTGYTWPT